MNSNRAMHSLTSSLGSGPDPHSAVGPGMPELQVACLPPLIPGWGECEEDTGPLAHALTKYCK